MHSIATIDITILLAYFITIMLVGFFYAHHKKETTKNYFLAGKSLGWFAIGTSLFATNISSEHLLGLAGSGAKSGLAVGNIEWLAVFFLIILGWFLAPLFLKSNIFTVPEFFGKRFNNTTRMYLSGISIFAYVLTKISITLFAGGLILREILGWDIYTSAIVMMIITGIYTIMGGLTAVTYTSVIQSFFIIIGAIILTGFGLHEVGGISGLQAKLPAEYFKIFRSASDPEFPWTGVIFGAPILAIWYWCTDQYIVQRILGAKNVDEARGGALLTAFLKILPVFIFVVPGLIAFALYPGIRGDEAFAALLTGSLLPAGFKGIVLAGVFAAIMSSLSACFISTSTLFTMDFYRHFNPKASDKKLVLVGRLSTIVIVIFGLFWIPVLRFLSTNLYLHLQSVQAFISPPIAAVFILGLFWKRANSTGAMSALIVGGLFGVLRLALEIFGKAWQIDSVILQWFLQINFLHFAVLIFSFSVIVMVVVSVLSEKPYYKSIGNYMISFSGIDLNKSGAKGLLGIIHSYSVKSIMSIFLVVLLLLFWGFFSL